MTGSAATRRDRLVAFLLRRVSTLGAIDAAIYVRVNGAPHERGGDRLAEAVSRIMLHGEGWVVFVAVALFVDPRARSGSLWDVVPAMWLATLVVNYPLKALFRRRRPFVDVVSAVVVGRRPSDTSFPSGHTAAAFAGAVLLAEHYPSAAAAFYGFALVTGWTRVYLGVHYPLDVAAGALLGSSLALLFHALLGWLYALVVGGGPPPGG